MPEEPGSGVLEQEKYIVKQAKKIALFAAGLAAQKYGKAIDREQEILVNVADIVDDIRYVHENFLLTIDRFSVFLRG